jgi:DNA modification methylase
MELNNECTLLMGDCLERMKEIPDGSVDMVLADPP